MANLYITEYATSGWTTASGLPCGMEPGLDQAPIAFSAATASAVFQATTRFIRVNTDGICSIKFGPTGTVATTANKRLNANQTEYFGVVGGQILSVITNT